MINYLDYYTSVIPNNQLESLEAFIEQSKSGLPVSTLDTLKLKANIGSKLYSNPLNPTNIDEYNRAIISAISDLKALYKEIDNLDKANNSLFNINRSELDRVYNTVKDIEQTIDRQLIIAKGLLNYTDVIHETFYTDYGDISVIPNYEYKLYVDPIDNKLKKKPIGTISRTITSSKKPMCRIKVENMLGESIESRHPVSEAIDGDYNTYWREVILSDAPIYADPYMVNWLPKGDTVQPYTGGAAVRLRIDFDYMTPISEVMIKSISPHPMHLLEIGWSSNIRAEKASGGVIPINGNLAVGDADFTGSGWTSVATTGVTASISSGDGLDGGNCIKVDATGVSGNASIYRTITGINQGSYYGVSFYMKRGSRDSKVTVSTSLVSMVSSAYDIPFWGIVPTQQVDWETGWQLLHYYFVVPPGLMLTETTSSIKLNFLIEGQDTEVFIDDIQLSNDYESIILKEEVQPASTILLSKYTKSPRIPVCCTMWLTFSQPHYELKHYTTPKGSLYINDLWLATLDNPASQSVYNNEVSKWRTTPITSFSDTRLPKTSTLYNQVNRLGGKLKSMLLQLYSLAKPSQEVIQVAKYEYILGAWEINLNYTEYAPEGIWASKPLDITGEIRNIQLVPHTDSSSGINYYITTKETDLVDLRNVDTEQQGLKKLDPPYYSATFRPSTETNSFGSSSQTIVVTPMSTSMSYFGSDRNHSVQLPNFPYTNIEKISYLHNKLEDEDHLKNSGYDPNSTRLSYVTLTVDYSNYTTGAISIPVMVEENKCVIFRAQEVTGDFRSLTTIINSGLSTSATVALIEPLDKIGFDSTGTWATVTEVASDRISVDTAFTSSRLPSAVAYIVKTDKLIRSIEGYRPAAVTLKFNTRTALPDIIGQGQNTSTKLIAGEVLQLEQAGSVVKENTTTTVDISTRNGTVTKQLVEESTLTGVTYATKYPVVWDATAGYGARISIYWHQKYSGTVDSDGNKVLNTDHSEDILISPSNYEVVQAGGSRGTGSNAGQSMYYGRTRISVKDTGFDQVLQATGSNEEEYEMVGYYRTTVPVDVTYSEYNLESDLPVTSGLTNLLSQAYPVTRNMTDYIKGRTPTLKKSNLEKSSEDYYPIYEYYIDEKGRIIFADDLFTYGDDPPIIDVAYETLNINPRLVVEFQKLNADGLTISTPILDGYTLLINSRK